MIWTHRYTTEFPLTVLTQESLVKVRVFTAQEWLACEPNTWNKSIFYDRMKHCKAHLIVTSNVIDSKGQSSWSILYLGKQVNICIPLNFFRYWTTPGEFYSSPYPECTSSIRGRLHVPTKPYIRHFWNWISFPSRNVPFGSCLPLGVQNSSGIMSYSRWILHPPPIEEAIKVNRMSKIWVGIISITNMVSIYSN